MEEEKKKELEKEEINPEDLEEENDDSISEEFAKTIAQKRDNLFRKAKKTT